MPEHSRRTIVSPSRSADHPDRAIDCQEALKPALAEIELSAVEAGWSENGIAEALRSHAEAGILALIENRRTAAAIRNDQSR